MTRFIPIVLIAALVAAPAQAQQPVDAAPAWRNVAAALTPGSLVKVRLGDGRRFTAVMVEARQDTVVLEPKMRRPVPVQAVPYTAIASLERVERSGGMAAGKAAAIGAATGAGVFLGLLMMLLASFD
jgi:hypothetical protein